MFEILLNEIRLEIEGARLDEVLTQAEMNRMRAQVATPEIRPCDFDVTIPGWLWRIEQWGQVRIHHKDPENFRGKKKVTKKQFLDRISDETLTKMLGRWQIVRRGLTKCEFQREYIGFNDRKYTEHFIIDVKLKKELRGLF